VIDLIDDLRTCFLFDKLSEPQLQRIAKNAVRIRLGDGEPLFEQGDRADRFYLVLAGQIKLYRLSPGGNEKVIDIVAGGNTFAEALMFLERPRYPVGAAALERSEVISIDSADFADMLRNSVDTCFLLLGDMSQRLRGLLRDINEISMQSAACRVAAYLVKIAPQGQARFELPFAKQIVASRLSVTPETFSRIIRKLIDEGIISVTGSEVTILDRPALEAAGDTCVAEHDYLYASTLPLVRG
jgi:CRP-like cAMP-binding protein